MKQLIAISLAVILVGCSSNQTAGPTQQPDQETSATASLSVAEVGEQVTKLYQEIDAAFDQSFAAGIDFVIANNYPGAFDPIALQTCAFEKEPLLGDNVTGGVPRVETLELIPNWVGRDSGAADWLLAGETIAGNVYKFDLEIDLEIITGEVVEADGQVFLLYGWCDDQPN